MEYVEAKEYCAMLMVCRKGIDKAIQKYKDKATRKQVKMLRELYADFDPESDKLFKETQQEIPWVEVQWGTKEDKFKLARPEAWISTFRKALGIYKSMSGNVKYSWVVNHFSRGIEIKTMAARYGVTRTTIYKVIDEFNNVLLVVAVQNRLITIEKNKALDEQEGEKGNV